MFLSETKDFNSKNLNIFSFNKVRRIQLTKLENSQLRAIFNQLETNVIETNKKLISLLIDKDSLNVERDSYLLKIENFCKISTNNSFKINSIDFIKNFTNNNNKFKFAKHMKSEFDSSDEDESLNYNNTCEEILNKIGY